MKVIALFLCFLFSYTTAFADGSGFADKKLAKHVALDTTNFDGNLSADDTHVQAALETLDEAIGDVESAGDCASGACGDGSSDGGTYYRLYDGDSHYVQFDSEDLDANRTLNAPNKSGTIATTDDIPTINVNCDAYSSGWNGVSTDAPCQDTVYDKIETVITEDGITLTSNVVHLQTAGDAVAIGTTTADAKLHVKGDATGEVTLRAQAAGSQTANVIDAVNSAGTNLFKVEPDGDGVFGDGSTGQIQTNQYLINATPTDDAFAGIVVSLTAGETLAIGDIGYMKSDGKVWKADADALATMPALYITTAAVSAEAAGTFGIMGFLRDDSAYNWTVGARLYVSTTAGALTETKPTGQDDVVCRPAIAKSADIVQWFGNCAEVEDSTT